MTHAARGRRQIRVPLLFVGATAWVLLIFEPGGHAMSTHHSDALSGNMPSGMSPSMTLDPGLAHSSPTSLAVGWALMVAAMMAPLLIEPVRHVRDRSFARRRVRAVVLFLTAYATVWMAAGVVLLALSLVTQLAGLDASLIVAVAVLGAFVWQSSPAKQRCLNRTHVHPELAAFGAAADIDAFLFGFTHAVWCVGSCWALMLLPLLVSRGHVAAMAAVTLWLAAERLERPMPPGWRLRGPGKAARLAIAHGRMWLQRSRDNLKGRRPVRIG
jgi:predicted metal-binding membrane protein